MIIGFNYNKVVVEKKKPLKGKVQIKRNLMVKDVKKETLKTKKDALRITFTYDVLYDPKVASIAIAGSLLYLTDDAKLVLDEWKKSKVIKDDAITHEVTNTILTKCTTRALQLADELNLPPPLEMPRVKASAK